MAQKTIHYKKLIDLHQTARAINQKTGLVLKQEDAYFRAQLNRIARKIAQNKKLLFVFIAGQFSSGKTTTANILKKMLFYFGIDAIHIPLHNFLHNTTDIIPEPDGTINYKSLNVLDLKIFNLCMQQLVKTKEVNFPIFDFKTGKRSTQTMPIKIRENTVILIEGLHALNPALYDDEISERALKLYVTANRQFSINKEVVLTTHNLRLMRRAYREFLTHGTNVEDTVKLWPEIHLGAETYIKPYKVTADYIIDTTHAYEPFLYKTGLLPLLLNIKNREPIRPLITALEVLDISIADGDILQTSMINEFLGKESLFY